MKSIKIISSYDCVVVCGQEQKFIEKGQIIVLDRDDIISIYPTQKGISFCLNTKDDKDCQFFKIIDAPSCKIFYLESGVLCENYMISTLSIMGNPCKVELGNKNINIEYLQFKKNIELPFKFDSYKMGAISSYVYVLLTNESCQNLILFDSENGKIENYYGDEIKIFGNRFTIAKNLDNIARHVLHEEYNVTAQGIILNSKQIDYQNGRPVLCSAPQIVPYAFLQAIEVGDFDLASSYLDVPMRRRVDKEHLESFFGKIKNFLQIDNDIFAVFGNEKSLFKFTLTENKISEIDKI